MRAVLHTNSASVVMAVLWGHTGFLFLFFQNILQWERERKRASQQMKNSATSYNKVLWFQKGQWTPALPTMPSPGAHGAGRQLVRSCNGKTTFLLPFQNIPSIQSESGKVSHGIKTMLGMTKVNRQRFSQHELKRTLFRDGSVIQVSSFPLYFPSTKNTTTFLTFGFHIHTLHWDLKSHCFSGSAGTHHSYKRGCPHKSSHKSSNLYHEVQRSWSCLL